MAKLTMAKPKIQVFKPKEAKVKVKEISRWGQNRGGRPWRRLRQEILERDEYTCQLCGKQTIDLECDHRVPLAQGGTDDKSNLQSLCKDCHSKKTSIESKGGNYYE